MKLWIIAAEEKSATSVNRTPGPGDVTPSITTPDDVEVDEAALMWRPGRDGGVVATGRLAATTTIKPWRLSDPALTKADVDFSVLCFTDPLTVRELRDMGLDEVVKAVRSLDYNRRSVSIDIAADSWNLLQQLVGQERPSTHAPTSWAVPAGSVVRRRQLHGAYGGSHRVSVGASGRTVEAFVFLDASRVDGLAPQWDGSTLFAAGQSQSTDSNHSSANLAVLGHRRRANPLRVFLTKKDGCLYLGEFAIDPDRPVESWLHTGQRDRFRNYPGLAATENLHAPLFRLRQLSGVPFPPDIAAAFRKAPRLDLQLHATAEGPASLIRNLLASVEAEPATLNMLGELGEAQLLAHLVERARRQVALNDLRTAVEDPATAESKLQRLLARMTWVFGGEFLPGPARRNLTLRDQLDLVLLRPDGTLHGVELKKAKVDDIITAHRSHMIVGACVNEAVGQAANYLRELDEKRAQILTDLHIDTRRASMTVVIGHSRFTDSSQQVVDETIRTFNSDRSRIRVTTYERLIEDAQRALDLGSSTE